MNRDETLTGNEIRYALMKAASLDEVRTERAARPTDTPKAQMRHQHTINQVLKVSVKNSGARITLLLISRSSDHSCWYDI